MRRRFTAAVNNAAAANVAGRPTTNASIVQNEVVDPDDGKRLSGDIYTGTSVGAGVDVAPWRWGGFGAQAAYLRDHQGALLPLQHRAVDAQGRRDNTVAIPPCAAPRVPPPILRICG